MAEIPAPPLLGREATEKLRALAQFLGGEMPVRPKDLTTAQTALTNDPDTTTFQWFARVFEAVNTQNETIWWFGPYRLKTRPSRGTVALGVGPRGGSQEDSIRFYRIDEGTLYRDELETDYEGVVRPRMELASSWDLEDRLLPQARNWHRRALERALLRLEREKDRSGTAEGLLVERILAKGATANWMDVIMGFSALGMELSSVIGAAYGEAKPPE